MGRFLGGAALLACGWNDGKSSLADEEWNLLREGPPTAGLVALSASSGGSFRELGDREGVRRGSKGARPHQVARRMLRVPGHEHEAAAIAAAERERLRGLVAGRPRTRSTSLRAASSAVQRVTDRARR